MYCTVTWNQYGSVVVTLKPFEEGFVPEEGKLQTLLILAGFELEVEWTATYVRTIDTSSAGDVAQVRECVEAVLSVN